MGRDALLILVDPVRRSTATSARLLNRSNDATVETMGSSLNIGPIGRG